MRKKIEVKFIKILRATEKDLGRRCTDKEIEEAKQIYKKVTGVDP